MPCQHTHLNTTRPRPRAGVRARGAFRSRRGVSLLEVVLASVLLSLIATAVVGAMTFVNRAEIRQRQQLAAFEVANRLILQFLDDPSGMPKQSLHYDDGTYIFRWSMSIEPVEIHLLSEGAMGKMSTDYGQRALNDTKILRARVFTGVSDGIGGYGYGEQLAELTRPYNNVAARLRNPDVTARLTDQKRLAEFINDILGYTGATNGESSSSSSSFSSGQRSSSGMWSQSGSGTAQPFGNSIRNGGNGGNK